MATHMQRKAPHREAGPWQIAVARLGDRFVSMLKGEAPTLTQESIRIAQTRQLYNNRKWLSTFPDFQYSPLEQSLARIIAWQRAQGLFV